MHEANRVSGQRTVTPAVVAAALFTVACALLSIGFVAARGGLDLPIASPRSSAVAALPSPSPAPTLSPGVPPSATPAGATPSLAPTPSTPTIPPSATPAGPTEKPDPLAALPACPDHPGCYEYLIRRGDTLSGVASRYLIPVATVLALNPEVADASTIVVGNVLYLGRSPFLRLEPCDGLHACYLYVVRPGDLLSTIAFRFGISVSSILEANPGIADANAIYSGQVIRLVEPAGT